MTYKDFELAVLHMHGVQAVKVVLTGDIQRKLKKSARKKFRNSAEFLPNDTFFVDLGEYTVTLFCKKSNRLMD